MLKYDIVWGYSAEDLVKRVNKKLEEGYRPIGNLLQQKQNDALLQAVVRDMTQAEFEEVENRKEEELNHA